MTKRAKIIIGTVIGVLLALAGVAALVSGFGVNPAKSSNQIKADVEKAFEGKDYFKEVKVKTYSGAAELEDPNVGAEDESRASAGVQISFTKMDAATFTEAAALLPELTMTAFYSIGNTADIANVTTVTGFKYEDLKNEETVKEIADSLKVRETFDGPYWQISNGDAEGSDPDKLKTQFVTNEATVTDIRKTVDEVVSAKMDALPVAKTDLSQGSFVQFAAVEGKMDNYDKGLELALKFADSAFLGGNAVVVLGLGDDIQISYTSLREGLDKDKLTEMAKELNKDQLFKVTVVSPEDAQAEAEATEDGEAPVENEATDEPTAETTESAAPAEEEKK